jgi:hypothetical protein
MIHGLHDVRGLDFPISRYRELCLAVGGRDWLGYGLIFDDLPDSRLLGLMNVQYVLTSTSLESEAQSGLRFLGRDGDVKVYENLEFLPRAYVVHRAQVRSEPGDVLSAMLDASFEPAAEVILERPLPFSLDRGGESAGERQSAARISGYEASRVTVEVDAVVDGFLFLSDTYYADWRAYVDGIETDIYRANYAFRAVPLEAGHHRVEFVYEPRHFGIASGGSALALGCILLLWLSEWRSRSEVGHQRILADSSA